MEHVYQFVSNLSWKNYWPTRYDKMDIRKNVYLINTVISIKKKKHARYIT